MTDFIYLISRIVRRGIVIILLATLLFASRASSNSNIFASSRNINESRPYSKSYMREIKNGELEILSLHLSYSNRVSKPNIKNNKLGFYLDDVWYYWAEGKILSEEDIIYIKDYSPHLFYTYSNDLPKLPEKNEINKVLIQEEYDRRRKQMPRNNKFLYQLYNAKNLQLVEKDIVLVRVLGFWVRVNKIIAPLLKEINTEINIIAQTDNEVSKFLSSLQTVSGYLLKDIAKSQNVSYHSYGLAFDILPKNNRKAIYWSWSRVNNKDWYAISYKNRWSPPKSVIEIFEKNGFVWGGKWLFFDTIHFEYRPETRHYNNLLLNREYAIKMLNQR